jgi:hypothetical protein
MICGKQRPEPELSGRICRACAQEVRRDATEKKVREKRASDRALRASGQPREPSRRER